MEKRNIIVKRLLMLIALPTFFLITNCEEVQLCTIPPPAPDTKLRIFIQPTSDFQPRHEWRMPYKKYEIKMHKAIREHLAKKEIYKALPSYYEHYAGIEDFILKPSTAKLLLLNQGQNRIGSNIRIENIKMEIFSNLKNRLALFTRNLFYNARMREIFRLISIENEREMIDD